VTAEHLHTAYLSRLAPESDYSVFSAIARTARESNAIHGIAGVLLFDGLHFFQWLHGPPDAVAALMRNIVADRRHAGLSIVFEALLPHGVAVDRQWRAGFIDSEALDEAVGNPGVDTAAFLACVQRLIERADLDAPLSVKA
jgi:hypothetical protein